MNNPAFFKPGADGTINPLTNMLGGNNMAAIHLAKAVGGDLFLGFISAVAFATILAVVSGPDAGGRLGGRPWAVFAAAGSTSTGGNPRL